MTPRDSGGAGGVQVVISDLCPPGKVFIIDSTALGVAEDGKTVVFHTDQEEFAVELEQLLAEQDRYADVLRRFTEVRNLLSPSPPSGAEPTEPTREEDTR